MKVYRICVESYFSNNSDLKEYHIYYFKEQSYEKAKEYAKKCLNNWNKKSNGIIYNLFTLEEENK